MTLKIANIQRYNAAALQSPQTDQIRMNKSKNDQQNRSENTPISDDEVFSKTHETLDPGLYLVSTPIGNLRDITLRALDVMRSADMILCEDTRHTGRLLQAYNITTPLNAYHDHSGEKLRQNYLHHLHNGKTLALLSDAGTPLISDPGYKLVQDCVAQNIKVTPVPGANAVLPALQLSALGSDKFIFLGFLPSKAGERKRLLQDFKTIQASLIFYESPNRVSQSLCECLEVLGDRPAAIIREITKLYETAIRGELSELVSNMQAGEKLKGEVVIVIGRAGEIQKEKKMVISELKENMKKLSLKDAVDLVYKDSGWRKKDVYDMALELKQSGK